VQKPEAYIRTIRTTMHRLQISRRRRGRIVGESLQEEPPSPIGSRARRPATTHRQPVQASSANATLS
jgi:hypothetical protein